MLKCIESFTDIVDELARQSGSDPWLAEQLGWVRQMAAEKGVTFYTMMFEILHGWGCEECAGDGAERSGGGGIPAGSVIFPSNRG